MSTRVNFGPRPGRWASTTFCFAKTGRPLSSVRTTSLSSSSSKTAGSGPSSACRSRSSSCAISPRTVVVMIGTPRKRPGGGKKTGQQGPSLLRNRLFVDGDRGRGGIGVGPLAPLIVLDAEVLEDLAVRRPELRGVGDRERLGERSRILDRHDALQRVEVGPRVAFDQVQLLGVRRSRAVEPEPVVEADGVDDEEDR